MNYDLNQASAAKQKTSTLAGLKKLLQLIAHERRNLLLAMCAILVNSGINLLGPYIVGHTIDKYVVTK